MGQERKKVKKNLEIRQRRIFSEEFKRQKVQLLIEKKISVKDLAELYGTTKMTVYRWLYKYSPHHQKGTIQAVQMESEADKTKQLQKQVADLERIVGQKQVQVDFLERLILLAGEELEVDLKKNFSIPASNGSAKTETDTATK